jgi:single-strand DNA-binding protein
MINEAHVFFAGYVAAEPSYKVFDNGSTQAKLRVASTARRLNRETGEWMDGPTSFVTVYCWRQLANNVALCVRKGEPVVVMGRLQVRRYQHRDGTPGTAVEVEASALGHDLNRGVAQFSRTRKPVGVTAAEKAGLLVAASLQAAAAPNGQPAPDRPEETIDPSTTGTVPGEAAADGVVDEEAVAEFARELSELREAPEVTHPPATSDPPTDNDPQANPPTEEPT